MRRFPNRGQRRFFVFMVKKTLENKLSVMFFKRANCLLKVYKYYYINDDLPVKRVFSGHIM